MVSVRTALDGKTARVTTNKLDEDSLRAAVESSLSLDKANRRALVCYLCQAKGLINVCSGLQKLRLS